MKEGIPQFITKVERQKSPDALLRGELIADVSSLAPEAQSVVLKFQAGDLLGGPEKSIFDKARNEWWINKYGFPFGNKIARHELLRRKYNPENANGGVAKLQNKLFKAIESGDSTTIDSVKKEYLSEYPNQLEGVEALFGLDDYFRKSEELKRQPHFNERVRVLLREITEYNFLMTDFVLGSRQDKEMLGLFWDVCDEVAQKSGHLHAMHVLQRAIVSQVAAHRVLQQSGYKPTLSHPSEDAFRSIDIWADENTAVQVKGTPKDEFLWETDEVAVPTTEVKHEGGSSFFSSLMFKEQQRFKMKISKYSKVKGRDMKGYFVAIPYEKIDFTTGEPAPELAEKFIGRFKTVR